MALTRPNFVHPQDQEPGKKSPERKSIFDIDSSYIDSSPVSKSSDKTHKKFSLKTSEPIFRGKERPEDLKLSIFDPDYYNKDYEDPGVYSLTYFDEPIPALENAYRSETSSPDSLISAGRFALSSAGNSRCSLYPGEMTREFAEHYLPGLTEPSLEPEKRLDLAEIRSVLRQSLATLEGEVYEAPRCRNLSKNLSDYILYQLKTMEYNRYRFTCIVNVGQNLGQDLRVVSRSLWNDQTDTFVTEHYQDKDLFAVAMVFAVYKE
eukprot:gene9933-10953_t